MSDICALAADAPERFTVDWHDRVAEFHLVRHADGRPAHYLFACPKCGCSVCLPHRVTFGPVGVMFDNPRGNAHSLECPHRCGWHVHVRNGRATDV